MYSIVFNRHGETVVVEPREVRKSDKVWKTMTKDEWWMFEIFCKRRGKYAMELSRAELDAMWEANITKEE